MTELGRPSPARLVALAAPVAVPLAMAGVFRIARRHLGERDAYVVGFAAYWATCAVLSVAILGPRGAADVLTRGASSGGRPTPLQAALLLWPPAGAVATRLLRELPGASPAMVGTSAAVAALNAPLEESLWRGVYLTLWPDDPWLGVVWPSVGFGLWHLAPQLIHPSPMGPVRYTAAATALGMSWGWVAWRTRSLRWTTLSHVVTDGSGIGNARFFLGRPVGGRR